MENTVNRNEMLKHVVEIILAHNNVCATVAKNGDVKLADSGDMFRMMEISHTFAIEGSRITGIARALGIDAKCNMQTGEISIYGVIEEKEDK